LVEIDPKTDKVVDRIALGGADENHGLLIDPEGRRAFIACEGNDRLLVLDLQTKKVTASFQVGKAPDVLAFDPGLHYVYVAGEAGVVSMFDVPFGQVSKIAEGFLGPNAHVVAVDATTHQAYFPLMILSDRSVLRITRPRPK
jgi:YVTN family beta-propeller protein